MCVINLARISSKQDCPWMLRINLLEQGDRIGQQLVVSNFNDKYNHPINPYVVSHHTKMRKLDTATVKVAADVLNLKLQTNKKLLLQTLWQKSGKNVLLKDLSNLQQKNKVPTLKTLKELMDHLNGSGLDLHIKVAHNGEEVEELFVMDNEMKTTYESYPEVLLMDATYKLTNDRMALYILMAIEQVIPRHVLLPRQETFGREVGTQKMRISAEKQRDALRLLLQFIYSKGLLAYRNTPLTASSKSPAQFLMGRRLSEPLLLHPSALTDEDHDADVNATIADRESQQAAYNHHSRELNELPVGSPVQVQDQSTKDWGTLAHVTDQVGPRSYEVTTSDGAMLHQNRQHPKPTVMCDASKPAPEEPASAAVSPPAPDESADGSPPDDSPAVRRGTRVRRAPDRLEYH
ncbi:hypothetical protein CAPTEDRAFT_188266 [Capitella teleta]|uniref:ZSWIM1/3 RNaseH-like domain-containing protein n=1 Tax=Capitella teleta TaxID=283909 RepID=R7TDT7_CAPTE|nr:hypothetical protein CAPTEDRAFT_188266 [Capitella teleta]|eukprot:ELT91869.1 hypothetical protein CAPTEDRAFT_188266 [Capitella teleta]